LRVNDIQDNPDFDLWRENHTVEVEESTVMLRKLNSCGCKKAVGFPMSL
jgi:hypothetical protein